MQFTRRHIVASAAAFATGAILYGPASAQVVTRPSHRNVSAAHLASYRKAIREMLNLDPANPHNWYRQAVVHLIECPHGMQNGLSLFLPWHRAYIRHFETLIRKYSGDATFNLPFWDWTDDQALPASFFEGELNPGHSSFIADFASFKSKFDPALVAFFNSMTPAQRQRANERFPSAAAVMDSIRSRPHFFAAAAARRKTLQTREFDQVLKQATGVANLTAILENTDFDIFSGEVEVPHGNVHVSGVGGFMSQFLSPVDPIFWLHHANVDRQWDIWTRRQSRLNCASSPTSPQWRNHQFLFFTDVNGQTLADSPAQYTDIAALGYSYATGSLASLATSGGTACLQPSQPMPLASALSNGPNTFRVARETNLALPVPLQSLTVERQRSIASTVVRAARLTARITVTIPPDTTNVRLKVFINCPYLDASTPPTDPHFVGSYTFFEASHVHTGTDHAVHHGAPAITFQLPLSPAIARLPAERSSDSELKFQIITEGPGSSGTTINAELQRVEIVRS